jgi:hypothetical protein
LPWGCCFLMVAITEASSDRLWLFWLHRLCKACVYTVCVRHPATV